MPLTSLKSLNSVKTAIIACLKSKFIKKIYYYRSCYKKQEIVTKKETENQNLQVVLKLGQSGIHGIHWILK